VSGTTITMGAADIWLSTTVNKTAICSMSSTHFVISYRMATGFQDSYAVSGTISGNTVSITVDSGTEFEASTLGAISIASLSSSSFIIAYCDASNLYVGKVIVGTLSGTAITISSGTGTTFETGPLDIYHKRISITSPNSSQFVISFVDEGDSYKGKVIQGAVSGTTIDVTLDSATTFETGSCGTGSLDWCTVAILGDYFAIAFTDNGDSNKGKVILGRYSAVRSGVVSISSVPSISVSGNATKNGAASISVVPSLTLVGNFQTIGMVSINAVSSLYMAGGTTKQGGVSIASIAFMIATWQTSGICSIQSIPSVLADGARSASGGVTINVVPSLSLDGMNLANGVAAISAVSSMSALADKYKFGTVTISSTSSMSALGVAYFAQIMGYTGTLTAGDVLVIDCDEQTVELNGVNMTKYFTGEFPQLYSGTNELRWEDDDGTYLWSCDANSDTIYKHSGGTSTISDSFASPGAIPRGLAWDGTNLWSCDSATDKIYKHSGATSAISTSFASPSTGPIGLTWDGTNLWSCDVDTGTIYKHSGGTSAITTSFSSPGTSPQGLAWDGTNLWSCDNVTNTIYKHSGGTSTIADSFAAPGTNIGGLAWDGTNLWSCDWTSDTIYKHSGGTSTITTSFSSPSILPRGLTYAFRDLSFETEHKPRYL